jgi:hypothetical protein
MTALAPDRIIQTTVAHPAERRQVLILIVGVVSIEVRDIQGSAAPAMAAAFPVTLEDRRPGASAPLVAVRSHRT